VQRVAVGCKGQGASMLLIATNVKVNTQVCITNRAGCCAVLYPFTEIAVGVLW
jgi:hypothetical protein